MDKYEFNLKVEQIKKLVSENDYATALKVVDGIDWNRVRNTNLLTLAASVYEENGQLEEAKDKLVMALERAPVGKRILYKLTELSVRSGNVEEAGDYYREYNSLAPDDPGCLLLQYMILKVKHAPYSQLIQCLELYNQYDPDEKWMYELATTYESAGRLQDAVGLCDRIALMFGSSIYGIKALKLKQKHTKLTEEQRALLYPNSIANAGVHYIKDDPGYVAQPVPREPEEPANMAGERLAAERIENEDAIFEAYVRTNDPLREAAPSAPAYVPEAREARAPRQKPSSAYAQSPGTVRAPEAEPVASENREPEPQNAAGQITPEAASAQAPGTENPQPAFEEQIPYEEEPGYAEPEISSAGAGFIVPEEDEDDEYIDSDYDDTEEPSEASVGISAAEPEEPAAPEPFEAEPGAEDDELHGQMSFDFAKVAASISAGASEAAQTVKKPVQSFSAAKDPDADTLLMDAQIASAKLKKEDPAPARPRPQARTTFTVSEPAPAPAKTAEPAEEAVRYPGFHLIVEAEDDQEGLDIAIEELKYIHAERGLSNGAVKTAAEKLNERGLGASVAAKISGKDFVIEHAGELEPEIADQVYELISSDENGTNVVLIDNSDGLDKLEEMKPELFDICDLITDVEAKEKDYSLPKNVPAQPAQKASREVPAEVSGDTRVVARKGAKNDLTGRANNVNFRAPENDDEIMSIDDFAQYCTQYASEIDCSISGKSQLALYERIELMEEDGIALTKRAAEDLIEEAADRAEKPPIGKRISGMFRSKYDKDGLLILKEEDFIY